MFQDAKSQKAFRIIAALVWLTSAGCWCGSPHVAGAPTVPPDEQVQTEGVHGYDLFIWHCVGGQHVVVSQWSGEMSCAAAKLERVACGQKTSVEIEVEKAGRGRHPIARW